MLKRAVLGAFAAHFGIPEGRHSTAEWQLGKTGGSRLEGYARGC